MSDPLRDEPRRKQRPEVGEAVRGATLGSIVSAFALQALLIVSGVMAARLLGVTDRGHLALLVLVPTILTTLGSLGVPLGLPYFATTGEASASCVGRSAARIAVVQIVLVLFAHALVLAVLLRDTSRDVRVAGVLTLALTPAFLVYAYALAILQSQQLFRQLNMLWITPSLLYTAALAALWMISSVDLVHVTVTFVAAWTLTSGYGAIGAIGSLHRDELTDATRPRAAELVRFGIKALVGSGTPADVIRVDQAVVGLFLSPAALGLYVVGIAFTNLPRFIAERVGAVAYPAIAESEDDVATRRLIWRFIGVGLGSAAVVVAGLELAAGWAVPFFFGEDFRPAVSITRILLLGALCVSARRVLTAAANGLGRPGYGGIAELASWGVLLPAMAILTPLGGLAGVAWAFVASAAGSCAVLLILVARTPSRQGKRDQHRLEEDRTPILPSA